MSPEHSAPNVRARPTAIRVDAVTKRYVIGAGGGAISLREAMTAAARAPFRFLARRSAVTSGSASQTTFHALRGVSFEVKEGEVLGIIGRNGAGKSTLLKVLSRITPPTTGRVEVQGRLGSLLEVGTGFHPDLSGRDNIFLNGAILGMKRREISEQFDEIVEFAGVSQFIDTPVKRYSSGMYLRLAFAVAAHLQTEILLVDEVLAVGDTAFQKKCLAKMEDVGRHGRTVMFVSHDMNAVARLCPRTILLDAGTVVEDGSTPTVVSHYLRSGTGTTALREWPDEATAPGDSVTRLRSVAVRNTAGVVSETHDIREDIRIEMVFDVLVGGYDLRPNLHFYNEQGVCVFISGDRDPTWQRKPRPRGTYTSSVVLPGNLLAEGMLIVSAAVTSLDPIVVHCWERDAVAFYVVESAQGDSARGDYTGPLPGVVRPLLTWTTRFSAAGGGSHT